jgi:hypothetical protein
MKMPGFVVVVTALSLMGGHAHASGPLPQDIFNAAIGGEFGEVIRTQALLEHVCNASSSANLLIGPSQKALAPFMPSLEGIDAEEWEQIAGTVYNHSLQYRAGYAAGVHRALEVLPRTGAPTPTAQICEAALTDAKQWTPK